MIRNIYNETEQVGRSIMLVFLSRADRRCSLLPAPTRLAVSRTRRTLVEMNYFHIRVFPRLAARLMAGKVCPQETAVDRRRGNRAKEREEARGK